MSADEGAMKIVDLNGKAFDRCVAANRRSARAIIAMRFDAVV
ncbi:hypothetical protein J2W34_000723 [Variovorax boronicumulans]|nr:hypothetical protein [Variovorax boronicumulans]MDQ0068949.1 hypothetical protein [Variovorax boronicumulans]